MNTVTCERCGHILRVADSPWCRDGHAPVLPDRTPLFQNYYDVGLGVEITGRDQRRRVMRDLKCDHRDPPKKGDVSTRLDRVHAQRKAAGRG